MSKVKGRLCAVAYVCFWIFFVFPYEKELELIFSYPQLFLFTLLSFGLPMVYFLWRDIKEPRKTSTGKLAILAAIGFAIGRAIGKKID